MSIEEFQKHEFFKHVSPDAISHYINNYDSPLYLYSKRIVTHAYTKLRKGLPSNFEIFYAQKSNPNKNILRHLNSLGVGCDTASLGEMDAALNAGFTADRIMFTGPAKREAELRYAVENSLLSINVESIQELMLVNEIAQEYDKEQNILVRINPLYEAGETTKIIGGTGVSKFGIDIEDIDDFFAALKKTTNVALKGIHIFNSSQILDWEKIYNNTKNVIDTAIKLSNKYVFEVTHVDLGGGFGIPYSAEEKPLDITRLGDELFKLVDSEEYKGFLDGVDLIFEPGRFLSGHSGIYLFKVLYTKTSRGKNILLTDGGIHHLLRPALIGTGHPVVNITAYYEKRTTKSNYMVAGPLCTSLDCFGEEICLTESKPGDILAVLNAGAYGFTESMPLFLSHPPAKEKFID
ncbi:MAG: diaminopimelate decarboxylase [Ignavibacteriota bacterium]